MINHRLPYTCEEHGKETTERHESFGLVSIHRIQGSTKLFGSHLENQHSYFVLEIKRADLNHGLGRNWFYGRQQLIEVHLSAAQFAEMITTLNMGTGTPCTIARVLGDHLEPPPLQNETETKKIKSSFAADLKSLASSLLSKAEKVEAILEKKALSQADRKEITSVLRGALQHVQANLPFVLESFHESTEKIVTQAKAEVDAFLALSIHKIGMDGMRTRLESGENPMKVLGKGSDDDAEDGR